MKKRIFETFNPFSASAAHYAETAYLAKNLLGFLMVVLLLLTILI